MISNIPRVRPKLTKVLVTAKKKFLTSMKLWQGLKRLMIKLPKVDSRKLKMRFSVIVFLGLIAVSDAHKLV